MDLESLLPKVASDKSQSVIDLCKKLAPGTQPVYLDVETHAGAIVNECYGNVEKIIKAKGGTIQYGWQIWETIPNRIIEAEFHAVWADSDGAFHDITPKALPADKILFLPDPVRTYGGKQIDSVRVALDETDNLIKKIIKNAEDFFTASNEGKIAYLRWIYAF